MMMDYMDTTMLPRNVPNLVTFRSLHATSDHPCTCLCKPLPIVVHGSPLKSRLRSPPILCSPFPWGGLGDTCTAGGKWKYSQKNGEDGENLWAHQSILSRTHSLALRIAGETFTMLMSSGEPLNLSESALSNIKGCHIRHEKG